MAREFAITLYLAVFKFFFTLFNYVPQKKKTTFVTSFGDNVLHVVKELEKQLDHSIIILKTKQCRVTFGAPSTRTVLSFEPYHVLHWFASIYHLATSRFIFTDNYFGFLAAANFKSNVTCVQLWHANGAIKQFGLKDPSNKNRSPKAMERFRRVYDRFDYVVVSSEKMANIFRKSFGLHDEKILRTGMPRTDLFHHVPAMDEMFIHFKMTHPSTYQKKILLYAPTFRDDSLHKPHIALDIEQLHAALGDEYVLLVRLHPAVRNNFVYRHADFIIDVSDYSDIHPLLIAADILITDYSSIPFEFALLEKPMIFFAYDLEEYSDKTGLWEDYETLVPGPIAIDTKELIQVIADNEFDYAKIKKFAEDWNEFAHGNATKRLINRLLHKN